LKKYYNSTDEKKAGQSMIHKIVHEKEAMELRPGPISKELFKRIWPDESYAAITLSIAVIIVIPRYNEATKAVEVLVIREKNSYNPQNITTKFPSGSMNFEDIDVQAAVQRESRTETGYESRDLKFAYAAEWSSTVPNERHIKVFFIAKSHEKVGEPTEKDVLEVKWMPFLDIEKTFPLYGFPKNQKVVLPEIQKKLVSVNTEMAYALMNKGTGPSPMEGVVE
jgi:ADP-ribose pyrophosphatase YjhB (NUDIX family)